MGEDTLLVMMRDGFTAAEGLLYEGGHGDVVRDSWHKLQDTLEEPLSGRIAALTRREVVAFMSATHQEPDLMAQLFVLRPQTGDEVRGPGTGSTAQE